VSGFQKRVALLEKWAPNLLPKIKDLDDLADIIYDTWLEAEADTEQRIIAILNDPIYNDLSRAHLIGVIQGASLDGEWD
jgi:hypothetical protein